MKTQCYDQAMTPPSKLAVEIAEAITRDILDRHMVNEGEGSVEDMQDAYDENEAVIQLESQIAAALIDAKLAPLVEDGERLDHLEAKRVPGISTHWHTGLAYMTTLRSGIDEDIARKRAIDQARAQRPAQEGSGDA